MSEKALIPIEQRVVLFYDDELTAVLVDVDGREVIYVPLKPLCDYLGVNWDGQRQRLRRDPVLTEVAEGTVVITAPSADGRGGGPQEMLSLPLDYLNGWLFGINANRVKKEIRERLITYQRECYRVLADAFLETAVSDDWMTTSPETRAALVQIQEMGLAIARMAEEHLRIMERLDNAAVIVGQHSRRISALERQLSPRNAITDEQAADIAEMVKGLAMALTDQDSSKNHFQAIFAELHRRFRVSSYKNIRQGQYQAVLDFLDEWTERMLQMSS